MAKERYASFEVAKLLQEKGFEGETHKVFDEDGELYDNSTLKSIPAPTQQVACDWCQEKDVLITYDLSNPFNDKLIVKVYREDYDLDWVEATTIIRDTLETAINAALEYALKNLI